jgi:hypothetical protein
MVTDRTRNRAQMILLGALALAVLIVGVSVVVNSLTTTRTAAPSQASPQIDEAREFGFESRKGTRSLVLRLNHRHRNVDAPALDDYVTANVTTYSQLLAESYASSHAEYVSIVYHNDSSAFGERLVQTGNDNLTHSDNPTDLVPSGLGTGTAKPRQLGWFTLNVDVRNTSREQAQIRVENDTHSVEYRINATRNSTLNVTSEVRDGGTTTGRATGICDPSRDRVLLDLVDGTSFSADCVFNGTRSIEGPYTVTVEDGDELVGKYELVYNDSVSSNPPNYVDPDECDTSVDADEPCTGPAVWIANVTASLDSSELSFTNDYNVSVYGATS